MNDNMPVLRLRRSELGVRMQAARDDAQRATSLGINVFAVRAKLR